MNNYEIGSPSAEKSKGCHCSVAVGFLLLLLAIAIAVGVGLIVHFAERDGREIVCNVNLAGITGSQGLQGCIDMARNNTEAVCNACSSKTTSSPAMSTHPPFTTRNTTINNITPNTTMNMPSNMTMNMTSNMTMNMTSNMTSPTPTPAPTSTPMKYPIRLPDHLIPISYRISVKPDFYSSSMSDFNLYGESSVYVMCHRDTSEIIMHLKEVHILNNSIIVRADNDVENLFESYEMYEPAEFIIIKTKTALTQGNNYTIEFKDFWAPLRTDSYGIYLGSWDEDGETTHGRGAVASFAYYRLQQFGKYWEGVYTSSYHVASQMEAPFARLAFPCFDEPAMKAVFDVTISRKEHVVAISNMPVMKTVNGTDGWVHDTFQQTPVMSTYLLAFAVGKFTNTSATYDNRFPVSIWSRDSQAGKRDYALNITKTLMKYFETKIGINYTLPKEDQIGMLTFEYAGMENWGAMMYHEDYLLYDEDEPNTIDKMGVTQTVAHEISHNWFGNLVSPVWWDDIWLNEGFANYMEYVGADIVNPKLSAIDLMMIFAFKLSMEYDASTSSHPVFIAGVETSAELDEIFDYISYEKGGYLLRMVHTLIGDDVFYKGMNRYINKHAYGNVRTQDLWDALQIEADLANSSFTDISGLMGPWIQQMGFPTVHVDFFEDGKLRLTQSRFLTDPTEEDYGIYQSEYGYRWNVPFTYTSSEEKNFDLISDVLITDYNDDSTVIQSDRIPSPTGDNWVIGNLQALGFFQVNYDRRNWEAIIKQLNTDHTVIEPLNRYQLIHDAVSLSKTGQLDLDIALRCMEYIRHEREYGPFTFFESEWVDIQRLTNGYSVFGQFRKFMIESLSQPYAELANAPVSGMTFSQELAKLVVRRASCKHGVPACSNYAVSQLGTWIDNPSNKPATIIDDEAFIFCNAVRYGGEREWEFMLHLYRNSSSQSERIDALFGMTCTHERWLMARYLDLLFTEITYTPQVIFVFTYMAGLSYERCMLWDWYRSNYDTMVENLGAPRTKRLLYLLSDGFNTEQRLQDLEQFALEKDITTHYYVANAIATVKENLQWVNTSLPVLQQWLTSLGY